MTSSIDFTKYVKGEPIKVIVRIKPPSNFQKEDIKINNQTIILTDTNNRIIEEHQLPEIYASDFSMQQIFDQSFAQYIGPFIQGFNVNIFAFGSSGSGKSLSIEGSKKEHGLIMFYNSQLFSLLENKKYHTNSAANSQISNYSYGVRVRFVEIIDEEINDLLAPPQRRISEQLQVVETTWEGPTISNSSLVSVTNETQLAEILLQGIRNRNNSSNEFGRLSYKATGFFQIELIQTSTLKETSIHQFIYELFSNLIDDPLVIISKMTFFDLPGSEVLNENPDSLRVKQGSTLNKVILQFSQLLRELGQKQQEYVRYDTSTVNILQKEILGSNSLTIGLFCVQNGTLFIFLNSQGDTKSTGQTLSLSKYCSNIQNFPIVNDAKILGLLHQFRVENQQVRFSSGQSKFAGDVISSNQKLIELEKKLIEDNLDKMKNADDKQKLAQKLTGLREKYNELIKQKGDLQSELIKSEEDKLEVSKALVELQIENTRLMEIIQNEKYEMNNKLLNAEGELLSLNTREEKALRLVQEIQDRMASIQEEHRDLETEYVSLKRNYLRASQQLELEKAKSENVGLELINIVNENKALHQELNDIYKKSGSTNEENAKYINKTERLEKENREQREAIIYSKAEIERLKTEMLKYEILEQQHKVDLDNKKLEIEKGFLEVNREKQSEQYKLNKDADLAMKKNLEDKMLWDSQKMELSQKIKTLQRRVNDYEERYKELEQAHDSLNNEQRQIQLQLDEMRSVYRNKLLQMTTNNDPSSQQGFKSLRTGYDLNAREELMRTYTEKEIELNEKLDRERKLVAQLKLEIRGAKSTARNLRYLAEDWAPVGVPLPDILQKEINFSNDDQQYGSLQAENQAEIERLRARNRKLENEIRVLQDSLVNATGRSQNDPNINKRLMNELEMLKGQQRPQSSNAQVDQIRKERNDLQEENRRLVQLLKDNKKWDVHILQRENDRLIKQIKDQELYQTNSIGPQSGENRNIQQKIQYYDKTIKQLEKERSEYMIRATMAEEQLKSLQEHLNRQTQDYQKKINDLKNNNKIY